MFLSSWHVVCWLYHGWTAHWSSSLPRQWPYPLTWLILTSLGVTWLVLTPLGITWLVLTSLGITWLILTSLGVTWLILTSLGVTWLILASLGVTWLILASLGVTWLILTSLGVTLRPRDLLALCHCKFVSLTYAIRYWSTNTNLTDSGDAW